MALISISAKPRFWRTRYSRFPRSHNAFLAPGKPCGWSGSHDDQIPRRSRLILAVNDDAFDPAQCAGLRLIRTRSTLIC